jgi:hypothetical protein
VESRWEGRKEGRFSRGVGRGVTKGVEEEADMDESLDGKGEKGAESSSTSRTGVPCGKRVGSQGSSSSGRSKLVAPACIRTASSKPARVLVICASLEVKAVMRAIRGERDSEEVEAEEDR